MAVLLRQVAIKTADALAAHLPEHSPAGVLKALETASFLGYVQKLPGRGPVEDRWRFIDQSNAHAHLATVVSTALKSRSLMEVAWADLYTPGRCRQGAEAGV